MHKGAIPSRGSKILAQRMLHVLALLMALLYIFVSHMLSNAREEFTRTFDDDIREIWTRQVSNFPVHPKDRYALHEMGFRTSEYAEALKGTEPRQIERAERLETALWGFMLPLLKRTTNSAKFRKQSLTKTSFQSRGLNRLDKSWLRRKAGRRWPLGKKLRRGIVTVAEQGELRGLMELITTLRYSLKDQSPIEIFYYGKEDMPEFINNAFNMMPNIRTIDLSELSLFGRGTFDGLGLKSLTQKRSAALQALALVLSNFDEVIYAAHGTVFVSEPSSMLNEPGYINTGTLFFHGLNSGQQSDANRFLNFLRQQFDQGQPTADLAASPFYNFGINTQQDPRVLVVDKSRPSVFAALLLNVWLHSPSIRDQIWHAHFPECLTESVWLAFELSKAPYHFEPAYPGAIGQYDGPIDELPWEPKICPAHALHFVGRSSYASRRGRPVWADGGLKLFPHHPEFLKVNAYSARGRWEQTNLGMCLIGADAQSTEKLALRDIYEQHRVIDETFEDIFSPIFELHNVSLH